MNPMVLLSFNQTHKYNKIIIKNIILVNWFVIIIIIIIINHWV